MISYLMNIGLKLPFVDDVNKFIKALDVKGKVDKVAEDASVTLQEASGAILLVKVFIIVLSIIILIGLILFIRKYGFRNLFKKGN